MKVKLIIVIVASLCFSCENQSLESKFDSSKAKIYFIQKWNTPCYHAKNNSMGKCIYEGGIILGIKSEDRVYFISDCPRDSGEECYFFVDALSTDPCLTEWWLSSINEMTDTISLEKAILRVSGVLNRSGFEGYTKSLIALIQGYKGKSAKEKILNYTLRKRERNYKY
jgi:hypothetical protein